MARSASQQTTENVVGPRETAAHHRERRRRANDRILLRLDAARSRLTAHHGSSPPLNGPSDVTAKITDIQQKLGDLVLKVGALTDLVTGLHYAQTNTAWRHGEDTGNTYNTGLATADLVYSPGVYAPHAGVSCSQPACHVDATGSYWETLVLSYTRIQFVEEFEKVMKRPPYFTTLCAKFGDPPSSTTGSTSSGDTFPIVFLLDSNRINVDVEPTTIMREALARACATFRVDPLDFDVTDSNARVVRVHKKTSELGIVANDTLELVKIRVPIVDVAADDPAPPRRRVVGKSASSALYQRNGALLKGTPVPTPRTSEAESDSESSY